MRGYIKPDPFFPITIGNILDEESKSIWRDDPTKATKRFKRVPKGGLMGKCKDL